METKECRFCGKIIEGFSHKDVEHRMLMHLMKHKKEQKEEQQNEKNSI